MEVVSALGVKPWQLLVQLMESAPGACSGGISLSDLAWLLRPLLSSALLPIDVYTLFCNLVLQQPEIDVEGKLRADM